MADNNANTASDDKSGAEKPSIWLGDKGRELCRKVMWGTFFATLAMSAWLIFGDMIFDLDIGLRSLLHPGSNIHVAITVTFGCLALLFAGIYFSDFRGAIEPQPEGFMDVFSLVLSRITMIGIFFIVLVMSFEVVSRYVFNKPTLWANEASLWIAGFAFLLAGLYAMQQRSHIRIYIIYDMFPRWLQKASDVLSVSLLWLFILAMIWGSYGEAIDKFTRMEVFGTAWDPPIPGTIKPGILIIISLVGIQAISNLIADWHKAPESHTPMDDIDESEIEHIRQSVKD